ncbi:alpha/beta hydrolase [Longispora albida]|uniref:alpha/beta hydrolase n=1 Tax=Longispora albida TaxID=203523 RepID=UPI00037C153F|nr:alpha/beta hydrolase-fold protein [Longispora albida]
MLIDTDFAWAGAAEAVLLRLTAETDEAYEAGDLGPYWMERGPDGWALRLALPAGLRTSYQICPVTDGPAEASPAPERWTAICAAGVPDPSAPLVLAAGNIFGNAGPASILELPDAPPQPWRDRRPGVPAGTLDRHELAGEVVHRYLPAGYRAGGTYPALIVFDGAFWLGVDLAATVDNLVAEGRIPPLAVFLVESGRGPSRWARLTKPEVLDPFVLDRLLPHVAEVAGSGPVYLAGQSLGGIGVTHLASQYPGRFAGVIVQSAALWWPGSDGGLTGRDILDRYRDAAPATPFFLEAGNREGELLGTVRELHATLLAHGATVHYGEYEGGHDMACWRGGLADGLVMLAGAPR